MIYDTLPAEVGQMIRRHAPDVRTKLSTSQKAFGYFKTRLPVVCPVLSRVPSSYRGGIALMTSTQACALGTWLADVFTVVTSTIAPKAFG